MNLEGLITIWVIFYRVDLLDELYQVNGRLLDIRPKIIHLGPPIPSNIFNVLERIPVSNTYRTLLEYNIMIWNCIERPSLPFQQLGKSFEYFFELDKYMYFFNGFYATKVVKHKKRKDQRVSIVKMQTHTKMYSNLWHCH